jgi:Membrane protein involved in the export of O-antigen and teichoic acid
MSLAQQMRRLARHSAIYGIGGLVSRILATVLLPLYTHYLPPSAYGQVEAITAATAVLAILLQLGIANAFFRFYFDAKEAREKLTVVRTSFWFTMGMATLGLVVGVIFAEQIAHLLGLGDAATLVRAGAVGLWAQTNYQQLTALFRVEERSVSYAIASVTNVLDHGRGDGAVRRRLPLGRGRPRRRQLHRTLVVYFALLIYRREQLGLEINRPLLRKMQHFGLPLVPSALALWVINFIDRQFVIWFKGPRRSGRLLSRRAYRVGHHVRSDRLPTRGPRSRTRSRTTAKQNAPTRSC